MKKKAKKKAKKKVAKKKTAKSKPAGPKGLWNKIHAVSQKVTEVESTGTEQDAEGNEYNFTQAKDIFKTYGKALNEVGLTFMPIGIVSDLDPNFYRATVTYRITDIDTGDYTEVVGCGLGCNGVWSINSCQTVARKQALLNAFGASYGDNDSVKDIVRKQMDGFDISKLIEFQKDHKAVVADIEKQAKDTFGV